MCAAVLISGKVAGFISLILIMQTLLFGISVFDFFLLLKISFIRCEYLVFPTQWIGCLCISFCFAHLVF